MLKNLKNKLNSNKGFSLVELIVVIAIMVILIALLVPNVVGYVQKAQNTANLAAAKSIYNAANTVVVDTKANTGVYPADITAVQTAITNDKLVSQPAGSTVNICYDSSNGAIEFVSVDDGKHVSVYNPSVPGDANGTDAVATGAAPAATAGGTVGTMTL